MTVFDDFNLKTQLILTILMSSLNFMLRRVEHEKTFIISEPGHKPCPETERS